MKNLALGLTFAVAAATGLAAQSATVKSTSKLEIKDGRNVVVTGCVRPLRSGTGYFLAHVRGEHVRSDVYTLVGKEDDLEKHVGELVRIEGKAADVGDDARVEIHNKTTVDRDGDDRTTESRSEMKGALDMPLLGVHSVKGLDRVCGPGW